MIAVQTDFEKINCNNCLNGFCEVVPKSDRLNSYIATSKLLTTYRIDMQPILNNGLLVYIISCKNTLKLLESKTKQMSRKIFSGNLKKKLQSTSVLREEQRIYSLKQYKFLSCSKSYFSTKNKCEMCFLVGQRKQKLEMFKQ